MRARRFAAPLCSLLLFGCTVTYSNQPGPYQPGPYQPGPYQPGQYQPAPYQPGAPAPQRYYPPGPSAPQQPAIVPGRPILMSPQNHPGIVAGNHISVVNNQVQLPGPILFDTGTANILPQSEPALMAVVQFMGENPQVNLLRIEGHTDTDGYPASLMQLSEERALAVAHWLVAKGVDCRRLFPVGFGGTAPIASNATDAGKAENRRVAFVVAIENGSPVTDAAGHPVPTNGGGQAQNAGNPCR